MILSSEEWGYTAFQNFCYKHFKAQARSVLFEELPGRVEGGSRKVGTFPWVETKSQGKILEGLLLQRLETHQGGRYYIS